MNLARTLQHAFPRAEWSLNGDDYSGLNWLDTLQPKPTLSECELIWTQIQSQSPIVPPVVVSFRALAFALLEAGLYEQVKTAALATTEGEIWWNTAQSTTVHRDHPFVIALGTAIGQTSNQLDDIFASAFASQSSQN